MKISKKRIAFFSAAEIAFPCLETLKQREDVNFCGIITQPGRAKGRGQKISLNPVAEWAQNHAIPFYQAEKMDAFAYQWLSDLQPDLIFVMAFGHILKKEFLSLPPLGMWNFHTSLLPKYRGASPIQAALLNGDEETGVTLMSMDEKMDAGAWLAQKKIKIKPQDTTVSLSDELAHVSAELLSETLPSLLTQDYILTPQNEAEVCFCKKFDKSSGLVNFTKSASIIERQVRAFYSWPGSYFFKQDERYILHEVHILSRAPVSDCGTFFTDQQKRHLYVTTGDGVLEIEKLQKAGGKILTASEFLRGNQKFLSNL